MILAAAAYAEDAKKNAPPPELSLAFQAEQWGVLPEPGGLRDQRAGELDRMTAALNTYRTMKEYKGLRKHEDRQKWRERNPQAWELYLDVLDLRKNGEEE